MTGWILAAVAAALALAAGAYRAGAAGRRASWRRHAVPPGDVPDGEAAEREAVLASLARRLQTLVHQEIRLVASLAARAEDPELRKGLLAIDHVATRMRRQTESLAVVGGAVPPRQWSGPVPVHELLRAAVAEVEHYPRVRIAPPVPGAVRPVAAGDIIHLVAELIDNATRFSPPQARTVLRAEVVRAGLAVEDRGPGLPPPDRQRLNALLAAPEGQASGLLDGGRVGLFVVASLARRHGIRVELNTSIYGGTQAVVVLPPELAGTVEPADAPAARPAALPGPAAPRPAVPPQPSAPQPSSPQPARHQPSSQQQSPPEPPPLPSPQPASSEQPAYPQPASSEEPASPLPASPRAPASRQPALPRRLPSSHLAPQLRSRPAPAATARPDVSLLQSVLDGLHRQL